MGLENTAHYLKAKGRGTDTELVHMSKEEVAALRKMAKEHGGDLTTNPHTGLPEAGFLSGILPTIVGAAASAFLGPEVDPLLLAGGIGLGDYAITGSLTKGLMAGLGAYGGASLTDAIQAASPAKELASAQDYINQGMDTDKALQLAKSNIDPTQLEQMTEQQVLNAKVLTDTTPGATPFEQLKSGFGQVSQDPMAFAKANYGKIGAALTPGLMGAMTPTTMSGLPSYAQATQSAYGQPLTRIPANAPGTFPTPPAQPYQAQYANYAVTPYQPAMMASGGIAGYANRGQVQQSSAQQTSIEDYLANAKASSSGRQTLMADARSGIPNAQYALSQMQQQQTLQDLSGEPTINYAAGGLGGYSDGGRMLKGPGDGMSDSIPATIGRKQPARLADGEFVVPADVVSHLGNGSTDAGAKRLYSMMDRIRAARTGKKKQAPAVKANKYLPA